MEIYQLTLILSIFKIASTALMWEPEIKTIKRGDGTVIRTSLMSYAKLEQDWRSHTSLFSQYDMSQTKRSCSMDCQNKPKCTTWCLKESFGMCEGYSQVFRAMPYEAYVSEGYECYEVTVSLC